MKKIIILALTLFCISFISAALTDNLISYWSLEESSGDAMDELGTNTLADAGSPTYSQTGKVNNAISFDGTDDAFTKASATIPSGNDLRSISVWYKAAEETTQHDGIVGMGSVVAVRKTFMLYQSNTNYFQFISIGDDEHFGNEVIPGDWYHIVIVYAASTKLLFYINGVNVENKTLGAIIDTNTDFAIGKSAYEARFAKGVIDEVGLWDRALSPEEVEELYNSGDGLAYPFAPVDTCTCAGAGNDWEIDMSDYCNITDACDLTTGTLSFTGEGITRCDAEIKTTNLGDPGSTGLLAILDDCIIYVS